MTDVADTIIAARRAAKGLPPLGALAPADEAAGYAIQRRMAERLGAMPPAGFKIGATGKQMQAYLGIASPIAGFVLAADVHASPATVRFADFIRPGVECEVGVRLGRDLPPGPCTRAQAEAAVADVFPAIEIVEQRYEDMSRLHTPTAVADQMFHRAGVIGAPCPGWRDLDLAAVTGRMTVAGAPHGEGLGSELLGHPMEALAWLAGSACAAVFGGLKAGQVVFLGSVTPPHWVQGPGLVEAAFGGLGAATLRFT